MGIVKKTPWTEQVKDKSADELLVLFSENGIIGNEWSKSSWLTDHGFGGLYQALLLRFSTWNGFLEFMGIEVIETKDWKEEIEACQTPNAFLRLFEQIALAREQWENSGWLQKNGHQALYRAIKTDNRFNNWPWEYFIACMDRKLPIEGIQTQQQAQEILRQEILRLRATGTWIAKTSKAPISREEWNEIRKQYEENIVVRVVADYLRSTSVPDQNK
jgi:hypothetical protein